jgi:ribosomal protein S18 acetylase RimI-like enzyme
VSDLVYFDSRIQANIAFKDFWQATEFYSSPKLLQKALLIKNEHWYQLFYDSHQKDGLQAAVELLKLLPENERDIKFASLPKELWIFVQNKWPKLHFNNHLICKFPTQKIAPYPSIQPLEISNIDYILQHQKYTEEYGGKPYVQHRIESGMTLGYKANGNLVAWAFLHDDMSMGFLRVLPEYRQQNIATQLTANFVNKIIAEQQNAIAYINKYNTASLKIANNLQAEVIGEVSWIRLRTPEEIASYEKGIF